MVKFLAGVPSADVDQETGKMLPECLEYNKRFNRSWGGYVGVGEGSKDDEQVFNDYHALVAKREAAVGLEPDVDGGVEVDEQAPAPARKRKSDQGAEQSAQEPVMEQAPESEAAAVALDTIS